jgi:putative ABC transport system permease protein
VTVAGALALLRRVRAERGALLLLGVLIAVTAALFGLAPRLYARMADAGLRAHLAAASTVERNLQLTETGYLAGSPNDTLDAVVRRGREVEVALPPAIRALITDRSVVAETARFNVYQPRTFSAYVTLRHDAALDELVRYVAGREPAAAVAQTVVPGITGIGNDPIEASVHEVALSRATAELLDIGLDETLFLTVDNPRFAAGEPEAYRAMRVVGLFEALDEEDPRWFGDLSLARPLLERIGPDLTIIHATAYIGAGAHAPVRQTSGLFRYSWRYFIDPARVDAGQLETLHDELRRLGTIYPALPPAMGAEGTSSHTGLQRVVEAFLAQRLASEAVLTLAGIGPAAVACGALGLIALAIVSRRRGELLLVRGRGISTGELLGAQLLEGSLLAVPVVALVAVGVDVVVPARLAEVSSLAAASVGLAAIAVLVGATLPALRAASRSGHGLERAALRPSARRLVLEATLAALAVAGVYLIRTRGFVGAAREGDGGPAADPLLAAVPLLLGLAAAVATARLYPYPVRLLGEMAAAGRGLVPALAMRRVGRHPTPGRWLLLVLLVTASVATFSLLVGDAVERAQRLSGWQEVGAPYRVSVPPGLDLGSADAARAPRVEEVAEAYTERGVTLGERGRDGRVTLHAVDVAALARVTAGTPLAGQLPGVLTALPPGDGEPGSEDRPIPAVVSPSTDLRPGDRVLATTGGRPLTVEVVARRDRIGGLAEDRWLAIDIGLLRSAYPEEPYRPTTAYLRASDDAHAEIADWVNAEASMARLFSRAQRYAALRDAPLVRAVGGGFAVAVPVCALYAMLAVAAAAVLDAAGRARDVASLRTLGLSGGQLRWLTALEHAPAVGVSLAVGTALGVAVALVCLPALDLDTFTGGAVPVAIRLDWPRLVAVQGVVLATAVGAIGLAAWLAGRTELARALRRADLE